MSGGEYREVWWRGKCSTFREIWRGGSSHGTCFCGLIIEMMVMRNE
jgi:hypothetical protein